MEIPEPVATTERRLIAMIEHDSHEPPAGFPERRAEAAWAAVSSLWHPALLSRVTTLPTIEGVEFPPVPEHSDVRLIAEGAGARLPLDYRQMGLNAGAAVIEGGIDRAAMARSVLEVLEPVVDLGDTADAMIQDFFALGTAKWWLRDLTIGMGHADCLDLDGLTRETLQAAKDWRSGDRTGAANRLRAAFEILTQAREKFYPVDAYLMDVLLLDVGSPAGSLTEALEARTPFTVMATASAIERAANIDADRIADLRTAVNEGWADVVGGPYAETTEPLSPLNSVLWQFRKGGEVYRTHLDDRNVETLATRRFALYPQRAQVSRRFGFRFAMHWGLDEGRFPVPLESKRLWESPDGSHLETLTRLPIAADRASESLYLPWRLAKSMKDDHVATVPIAHWASPVAGWYRDFRRMIAHSPVLARAVTMGDFFHLSDRPWEMLRGKPDDYLTPYLTQSLARNAPDPTSRRARHARLRSRLDAMITLDALASALTTPNREPSDDFSSKGPINASDARFFEIEEPLETGRLDEAESQISAKEPETHSAIARAILGERDSGSSGYLVVNPTGIARRAPVILPDAPDDIRPSGPLLAAQLIEEGVVAVVEVAPFGFAWIPKTSDTSLPVAAFGIVGVEGRTLRNEVIEVEFDAASGGIRGIRAKGEPTARLGQQIAIAGLHDAEGKPASAKMVGEDFAVDYAGPALVRASSRGALLHPSDGRRLATFRQEVRLWRGRPILEIDIALEDLDEAWLSSLGNDAWGSFLSCRWAWPDPASTMRRSQLLALASTEADRPETPDAIEITSRKQRTTLLFGGLAHHQRHGKRMLDTLLISGKESARTFQFGVTLDHDNAHAAATDFLAVAPVIASESGPPPGGDTGWLVNVDRASVAVVKVEFVPVTGDGRGWGLAIVLAETSGFASRSKIRFFRNPIGARQTDFHGEMVIDLPTDGDSVPVDLTPHELMRLEVTLGS